MHDVHLAAFRYDVLSRMPLVKQRTLLLFGTRDHFVFPYRELATSLVPNAETRVGEDAGVLAAL